MAVIHKYDYKTLKDAPDFVIDKYFREHKDGALCVIVGKTTHKTEEVTCKNCIKIINQDI